MDDDSQADVLPHATGWPRPLAEVYTPGGDLDLLLLWTTPIMVVPRDRVAIADALYNGTEASSVTMGSKAGSVSVRVVDGRRHLAWTSPEHWTKNERIGVELTEHEARNLARQIRVGLEAGR